MSNPKAANRRPPRVGAAQENCGKILNSINAIDEARGGDGTARSIRETYRLLSSGQLPGFKLGNKWKSTQAAIDAHYAKLLERTAAS